VLENLLGTRVPDPPPNVPPLPDAAAGDGPKTVRARLEMHRRSPVCASCHRLMDPVGLSLENFDATGRWRDNDAGEPIDASGTLADGTPVNGPSELRAALAARSDQFVRTFAEKLFIYALGRGMEGSDRPAIDVAIKKAAARGDRWSAMIQAVVESAPFQSIQVPTTNHTE
jgi:hypothetical protein